MLPGVYFNGLVFTKCTHVWSYYQWTHVCTFQIDLQLYVYSYMYLERRYMHFEKVNIVFFILCRLWTLLEHLNIKSLHMYVQYRYLHTNGVPAPVECPLRETWGHGLDPGSRHTKVFKMVLAAPRRVRIMWLGVASCQVSGAWYFSDATHEKWALSSLSQPDTVVIWLKNCWKRR